MSSRFVPDYSQTVVSGTTSGVVTVADSSGFYAGAKGWIRGPSGTPESRAVIFRDIPSATTVTVGYDEVGADYLADVSGYGTGTLYMEAQLVEGGSPDGDAPSDATYLTGSPNSDLSNEQALSLLTDGLLKHTGATLQRAAPDVDYATPGASAPSAALYLVLSASAALSAERVFTPSSGLTAVDAGAGAAYTLTNDFATGKNQATSTVIGGTLTGQVLKLKANAVDASFLTIPAGALLTSGILKHAAGTIATASAGVDYENPLTFGNGLTRTVNAVANDHTTGVNQATSTIVGGTLTTQVLVIKPNLVDSETLKITANSVAVGLTGNVNLGGFASALTVSAGTSGTAKVGVELQGNRASDGLSVAEVLFYNAATQICSIAAIRQGSGILGDIAFGAGGAVRYTIANTGEHTFALPAVATTSFVKVTSATATSRPMRFGASSAATLSQFINITYSGSAYSSDDATVCTWENNYNLGSTPATTSWTVAVGTAAATPTRSGVYTFQGDGSVIVGGANQNSTRSFLVVNGDAGTAAQALIQVQNTGGDASSVLTMGVLGTGFTTTGAFFQDGGYLFTGANISGGLSIVAAHATTGVLRLYTGGAAAGNLAATVNATGELGLGIVASSNFILSMSRAVSGGNVSAQLYNSSNTANSGTRFIIQAGGTSAGDPFMYFTVPSGADWTMGIDNSVSGDPLVIAASAALGTTDVLRILTTGEVGFGVTPASNAIISASRAVSGATLSSILTNSSNTASSHARQVVQAGGTSAGDAFTNYTIGSVDWSIGLDNSVSGDPLVISASAALGTTDVVSFTATSLTFSDAVNFVFNTGTGTKLGTATTQKIGLWNVNPVIQPATTGTTTGFTANASANAVFNESTFSGGVGTKLYTISDIVLALKQSGNLAAS